MPTMTHEEIYGKVAETLVDSLNVDEEEIRPESTLQGDLGAESIDFLDIVFRLERGFGIKIQRNELFPESIFQGDPQFVQNGKVTQKGIDELRHRLPFANVDAFAADPQMSNISNLFTVNMIANFIESRLKASNN
jgi:acyl carrier protein